MDGVTLTLTHRDSGKSVRYEGALPVVVGREDGPDTIVLDELTVSRRHARLDYDGLRLLVTDLGSANGTTVNGDRVQQRALAADDRLMIGSYVVTWTLPGTLAGTAVIPLPAAVTASPARRVVEAAEAHNAAAGHELDGFLSRAHGFLPVAPPLTELPSSHAEWDAMVPELPELTRTLSLRRAFDRLPVLDAGPDALSDQHLLRASTMLGVFAHAYHYLTPEPAALPECLDRPWRTVAARLGRSAPHLSYIDLFFYNWRLREESGPRVLDNMELLVPLWGNTAERVFYLVTTEFAARQAPILAAMTAAQDAVLARDRDALAACLLTIQEQFRRLTEVIYPQIDPNPYGTHHLDQVLWAKTVGVAGVPVVEGAPSPSGTAQPHTHAIDAFLERRVRDSVVGRQSISASAHFPRQWRELIAALNRVSVRGFVEDSRDAGLRGLYNAMLDAYAGDRGWMGLHRIKAYGFLEVAFKVGREVTTGARFTGLFKDRTWDMVDRELAVVRDERRPPVPQPVVFGLPRGGTLTSENGADGDAWTCHVELDVSGQGVHFHPGDRIGVLAENDDELVRRTLAALQATGDELVGLSPRWRDAVALRAGYGEDVEVLPLRALLTFGRIRPVHRDVAKRLVALSASGSLSRITGARMEDQWELWDLLNLLHAGGFDVTRLWRADPRDDDSICAVVAPEDFRFYSIASAMPPGSTASAGATTVRLVVGGLGYSSPRTPFSYPQRRRGSASWFLRRVATERRFRNKRISLRIMPTPRFRLPDDPARPVVMFAGGSGIAPFHGFVRARDEADASGATILYAGWRGPAGDGGIAHADDLAAAAARGHLTVHTAFSRADVRTRFDAGRGRFVIEEAPRARVPDLITSVEHADALWELLRDGYFYVCGRTGFAVSVLDALETVAAARLGSAGAARELMRTLVAEGRLMLDVFTTYGGHALQGPVHETSDLVRANNAEHGYRMAVSGKVYDVGEFMLRHPGGPDIVRHYAGTDATDAYRQVRHHENPEIDAQLGMYEVGTLRRLRFGTTWRPVLTADGLRFCSLEDLFTAWVRFAYLVVGMQNALTSDYGFADAVATAGEEPAAGSPFKDQYAVESHRRFLVSYLDGLTGDDLAELWRRTAGFCAPGTDVRELDERIAAVHRSAHYRLVRNLTGHVRGWAAGVAQGDAVPERLAAACALFRREDTAVLDELKEALRAGLVAFETHEASVVERAGPDLVAALAAVPDIVDGYYRRIADGAARLGVTAADLPDEVQEPPVRPDAGLPGHGGPWEEPEPEHANA